MAKILKGQEHKNIENIGLKLPDGTIVGVSTYVLSGEEFDEPFGDGTFGELLLSNIVKVDGTKALPHNILVTSNKEQTTLHYLFVDENSTPIPVPEDLIPTVQFIVTEILNDIYDVVINVTN
jgi:hypothetical protein